MVEIINNDDIPESAYEKTVSFKATMCWADMIKILRAVQKHDNELYYKLKDGILKDLQSKK